MCIVGVCDKFSGRQAGNIGERSTESGADERARTTSELSQDPELLKEFIVEVREHLAAVERGVLKLERDAYSTDTLNAVFRGFHTIKGLAGFLGFTTIAEIAHEVETLLDLARNGALTLSPSRIDAVLAAGDYIGGWLRYIERSRSGLATSPPIGKTAAIERIRASVISTDGDRTAAIGPHQAALDAPSTEREAPVVKVDTAKLEHLVDMVSELLITEAMLRHHPRLAESPQVQQDLARLGRVTSEIQKTALAMRMVQIGQLFRRMTRLVRDLASQSGKLAEIDFSGEEIELDRAVVEDLSDPLLHMLRNSMDHGLEPPAERQAAGKPPRGRIRLAASQEPGYVIVKVSDDGRGLNRERILQNAIERGVVDPAKRLTDSDVSRLVFVAGVSTAEKVTGMSGRGVGMDVVRRQIERLGGEIAIESVEGKGTCFLLKIPLDDGLGP